MLEHPAEAFFAVNFFRDALLIFRRRCRGWLDCYIANPLVRTLAVVVFNVLAYDMPKLLLAEEDHLVQALMLDGSGEPLSVGVEVWRAWRQSFARHTGCLEDFAELLGEQRIAIVDQHRFVLERPTEAIGHVPSLAIRFRSNPDDLDLASLQIDDEQSQASGEPEVVPDLDGEEVGRGERAPMIFEEIIPTGLVPIRHRIKPVGMQDVRDAALADNMPKFAQFPSDTGDNPSHGFVERIGGPVP